jgi:hypothetical protein
MQVRSVAAEDGLNLNGMAQGKKNISVSSQTGDDQRARRGMVLQREGKTA